MALLDILIPTYRRKTGLAMLLSSLLGQTFTDFDVVISDQTPTAQSYVDSIEIEQAARALRLHGHDVKIVRHVPPRGLAEQRQFLFEQSRAPFVQYLDDDLLLEPRVVERMTTVMQEQRCGFVGCAALGLEFAGDVRPHQQEIEPWEGPVQPEPITPETIPWRRHLVNNAANPLHLAQRLSPGGQPLPYKVAWVGGNVLYDRAKLADVGAFSFWPRLPVAHAGEEVVVQFMLLRYHGGCGVLPSGTYHLGLPTTVPDRQHNATALFGELIREYEARHRGARPRLIPSPAVAGGGP